ncbi:MFS transporter [Rhizohabitans arisaemae]|uniref:MFS transporter n=1 Tax=Rhizohabitans arisaemae TaxID=2720610 RepID=UPI0024B19E31|nr:MFS transporter [Rhizohabitans arisaemae]
MRARTSARLGADFSKLWTATAISNIGDGITMAAGPLLIASLTADPAAVAAAVFVQQLPWLLFALISGAYVDRVDRRRLIVVVNLLRGLALAALTVTVATDLVSLPVVYLTLFLLGAGETLADTAAGAILPAVVPPERLAGANARLMATFTLGNQFLAKPLGAALFVVAAALPFGVDALTFLVAAALMAWVRPIPAQPSEPSAGLRAEIAAGVRWLWRHRLMRTLTVSMGLSNVVFGAAFSVFVLYVQQRLGLSELGYGLLLTTFGVGGLVGTGLAARLQARFGAAVLLRAGLVVEASTHAVLALATTAWIAVPTLVFFGIHAMVWGVIAVTLRQRVVPPDLLGRVGSVNALFDVGGSALGALLGGLLASTLGITAPFWTAAVVVTVITIVAWRRLGEAPGK